MVFTPVADKEIINCFASWGPINPGSFYCAAMLKIWACFLDVEGFLVANMVPL